MNKNTIIGTLTAVVVMSFLSFTSCTQQTQTEETGALTNVDIVNKMYADVSAGDVPAFLGVLDSLVEWNEAENFPYSDGNPYIGPDAVVEGVFARLGAEWEYFDVVDLHVYDMADNMVLATGRYKAKYNETGKMIYAQCAHLWTLKDGKVVQFQQYTDTEQVIMAMQP